MSQKVLGKAGRPLKGRLRTRATRVLTAMLLGAGLLCFAACAPGQASTEAGGGASQDKAMQQASVEGSFEFTPEADCGTCHSIEADSQGDASCTASLHGQLACMDCHTDLDAIASAHASVEYGDRTAKRLKSTKVGEESCLASDCHGSYEALAEKTADSTVLVDSNGTQVNPHAMPESDDHATLSCGNCHAMHDTAGIEETAPQACLGCHHTGVYECYTCHD